MKNMYIPVDAGLETPIYKQIADFLYREITVGRIERGVKLPTVRELAERLGIARGTIKRAYDELAKMGGVEMKQGQGTFVVYNKLAHDSRKARAMETIDRLFSELDELGFSAEEMDIFFDLKLRERARTENDVRVLLKGDSPELLHDMTEQIYELGGVDVYSQLINQKSADVRIGSGADIVVARQGIPMQGLSMGQDGDMNIFVAIVPDFDTVASIARLKESDSVAAIALCDIYLDEMLNILRRFAPNSCLRGLTMAEENKIYEFLADKTAIVVPNGYERLLTAEVVAAIHESGLKVIRCQIRMDEGSMLRLADKIKQIRDERRIGIK